MKKTIEPLLAHAVDVQIDARSRQTAEDPVLEEAIRLFRDDYTRLRGKHPRYYAVLAILSKFWTHRLPTLAVGLSKAGTHQLYINPTFYTALSEQVHRLAVLMHEVHHIVLGHCVANEWPQYLLNQPATFTVACELAANTHVPLPLPTEPVRPIVPDDYGLPERLTTLEYFLRIMNKPSLKNRIRSVARRIRRNDASGLPDMAGRAKSKRPKRSNLPVLRAAAEVGDDERDVLAALSRDRLRDRPASETNRPLPDVPSVDGHGTPTDEWQAAHCIAIDGDIRDGRVLARILNSLVEDVTRGYSLGGRFRSRTFKRQSRRNAGAFGCPGVRKTGGGPAMELDLCFVVDATSSMSPYLQNVANSLFWLTERLARWRSIDWRVGLTWYRDVLCDADYFRQHPFTRDIAQARRHLESLRAEGGGDEPESVAYALYHAARRDDVTYDFATVRTVDPWRPNAKRAVFIVTDATGHGQDGDIAIPDAVRAALAAGVRVYILGPWSWTPYQQMAQLTKGKLFRVERSVPRE